MVGIKTNLAFHRLVMDHPAFLSGEYNTGFIDAHKDDLLPAEPEADTLSMAAAAIAQANREARATAQSGAATAGGPSAWRTSVRWRS